MTNQYVGEYMTSVYKAGIPGWRQELVTARMERISDKRARVVEVIDITEGTSKRQSYHVDGVKAREVGKVKNIGSLASFVEASE